MWCCRFRAEHVRRGDQLRNGEFQLRRSLTPTKRRGKEVPLARHALELVCATRHTAIEGWDCE
jgi:hypothetical protein